MYSKLFKNVEWQNSITFKAPICRLGYSNLTGNVVYSPIYSILEPKNMTNKQQLPRLGELSTL